MTRRREANREQISVILERVSELYDRMIESNPEILPCIAFVPIEDERF